MNLNVFGVIVLLGHITCCLGIVIGESQEYYRSLPRVNFSLADIQKTDIIYTLFTTSSPTVGKVITEETSNTFILDKHISTILFMHGWRDDDSIPWYKLLRDEYFKLGPHNIIFLNWSKAGNKSYEVSSANVKPGGMYITKLLLASKVCLDKVHLVGSSMGAQLAAYTGKSLAIFGKKVGRLTALDPAYPMFGNASMKKSERLNSQDAKFVDVVHTYIQYYGFSIPIGHVDFYPNGGTSQPGCKSEIENPVCSHSRSNNYFVESVRTKAIAKEAKFNEDDNYVVTITTKQNGKEVIFGEHVDRQLRGVYYFTTNSVEPFLNGTKI